MGEADALGQASGSLGCRGGSSAWAGQRGSSPVGVGRELSAASISCNRVSAPYFKFVQAASYRDGAEKGELHFGRRWKTRQMAETGDDSEGRQVQDAASGAGDSNFNSPSQLKTPSEVLQTESEMNGL